MKRFLVFFHLFSDDGSNFRSNSPRSKKPRGDRICVHISNLPFRVKESEIRRYDYNIK